MHPREQIRIKPPTPEWAEAFTRAAAAHGLKDTGLAAFAITQFLKNEGFLASSQTEEAAR